MSFLGEASANFKLMSASLLFHHLSCSGTLFFTDIDGWQALWILWVDKVPGQHNRVCRVHFYIIFFCFLCEG